MSEAAKLFSQNGGAASGNQQDAVNSAAATVMKLLLKSQMSSTMGGGNSGGLGGLMCTFYSFLSFFASSINVLISCSRFATAMASKFM